MTKSPPLSLDELPPLFKTRTAVEVSPVSETRICKAIAAGEFRSSLVRRPGGRGGVRLIERDSFLAWLRGESAAASTPDARQS